ncbi:MAG: beta strand repeat-containing protein [Candidatus Aquicultor sp.]
MTTTRQIGSNSLDTMFDNRETRAMRGKLKFVLLIAVFAMLTMTVLVAPAFAATSVITSPTANSYIEGSVPVIGTTTNAYKIEYGVGATPAIWTQFATGSSAVTNNTLGTWASTGVGDGGYTLRVTLTRGAASSSQVFVDVDNTNPTATITAPANNSNVSGVVTITGSANDTNFSNYVLDYGAGAVPASWTTITNSTSAVTNNTLGVLDTGALASCDYTLRLTSTDKANNTTTATILVHLDGTPPATMLSTAPSSADGNNGWFKSAATITLSRSEAGTTYYKWNTAPSYSVYVTPISAPAGSNTLYYYSVDTAENTETVGSQVINVDTASPTSFTLSSPADAAWLKVQKPTLSWNASSDALSGLAKYIVKVDGAVDQQVGPAVISTQTAATLAAGSHTWLVIAEDTAGNQTTSTARTINIDITNPITSITSPSKNSTVTGTSSIIGTASDTNLTSYLLEYGSGAAPSSWTTITNSSTGVTNGTLGIFNTGSLTNGDYTIRLTSTDRAGNTATTSILVHVDKVAPVTALSTSPATTDGNNGWFKSAANVTLTSNEPGTIYYKWNTAPSYSVYTTPIAAPSGSNTIWYYSVDTSGNTETAGSQTIKVDTTTPSPFALASPANGSFSANQRPTLSWNASADTGSGLAKYLIKIDGATDQQVGSTVISTPTASPIADGPHTWQIVAEDIAGNQTTSASRTINIDTVNPTATITSPLNSATISGTTSIIGTASDANFASYVLEYGSGVAPSSWTTITASSSAVTNSTLGTLNTLSLTSGMYTIRLTTTDQSGKTSSASVSVTVSNDTIPPVTSYSTNPAAPNGNNSWFKSATTIILTSSDPGTTYYKWNTTPGYSVYAAPVAALPGTNTLWYYSVDSSGNTETAGSQVLRVDTGTPAGFTLSAPADSTWTTTQRPTLSWNASSDAVSGLAKYIVKVDGVVDQQVSTSTLSTQTATTLASGPHTWQIVAEDSAGNQVTSATRTINVDATNPTASITAPLNNATITGTVNIQGTASDTNFSNYKLEYGAGASPSSWTTITNSSSGVTNGTLGTLNAGSLASGDYMMRLSATDSAGNTATTSILVHVDSTVPTTTLSTTPATADGNNGWFKSAATITLSRSEAGSSWYKWNTAPSYSVYSSPVTALSGTNTLWYYSADTAGNTETAKSQVIKVDTGTPAGFTLSAPADATWTATQKPMLSWNASSDAVSGLAKYIVKVDGTIDQQVSTSIVSTQTAATLTQGQHTWQVVAEDVAGNQVASATRTINVDTANPTANITSPTNNTTETTTFNIVGTASDANFSNYKLEYGAGASPSSWTTITNSSSAVTNNTLGSLNAASLSNGSYTIKLTVTDGASKVSTASVLISVANDVLPPVSSYTTTPSAPDGNNGWFKSPTTTFAVSSNETGSRWYKLNADPGYSFYTAPVSLPEGVNTLSYYAVDVSNNTETPPHSATIKVDWSAPSTVPSPSSPLDGVWISNQAPTFAWNSSSDAVSGIAKYKLMIDGVFNKEVASSVTAMTPASALSAGSHTWQIIAEDAAGNQTSSGAPRNLNIDITKPTAAITSPAANATVKGSVTVTGTAGDNVQIESYTLEYINANGGSPSSWTKFAEGFNTSINNGVLGTLNTVGLSDDKYTIRLTVTDITGQTNTASVSVTTTNGDTTNPTTPGSFNAVPLDTKTPATGRVYLSWLASTDNKAVAGYRVYKKVGTNNVLLVTTTGTSKMLTNLPEKTTYELFVEAYDAAGNASDPSTVLTVTTFAAPITVTKMNQPVVLGPVTLTYPQNATPGTVEVTGSVNPAQPLPITVAMVPGTAYDIDSTVVFTGSTTVTVSYDPSRVPGDQNTLQLWHWDGSQWENTTISRDIANHTITGKFTHFSGAVIINPLTGLPETFAYGMNTNILFILAIMMLSIGGYLVSTRRTGLL